MTRNTPPLKHILVLDGPNATETLGALSLIDQFPGERSDSKNPFADSCEPMARKHRLTHAERIHPLARGRGKRFTGEDAPAYESESTRQLSEEEAQDGPDELARRAIIRHPALRTRDGMQLYCFRDRFPYRPGQDEADPNAHDPNHLEYWIRRVEEQLESGEKIDAVIIPAVTGPLRACVLKPFLAKLKEREPAPVIIQIGLQGNIADSLADLVIAGPKPYEVGDSIRNYLNIPPLTKQTVEDTRRLNDENARLKKLNQGYTPATLPSWLKRPGDPGYTPPGRDGKDTGRG